MTRLCFVFAALAVIAQTRVTVLPGWVVPLPSLLIAAQVLACLAVLAWVTLRILQRQATAGDDTAAPEPAGGES